MEALTVLQQIQLFTVGLRDDIVVDVELDRPEDLQEAMSLAHAYECKATRLATTASRPTHKCARLFYIEYDDSTPEEDDINAEDISDEPRVTLNALSGVGDVDTMHLLVNLAGSNVVALIDSRSTLHDRLLRTLGPTLWDFNRMRMAIWRSTREVTLHGLADCCSSHFAAINFGNIMGRLLEEFEDIFTEPRGLPSARPIDHPICLKPDASLVAVRPCHYPQLPKDELEQQCPAMLKQGIIRPNTSSFSSSVLVVCKHDGSWWFCVDYHALNTATVKDKFTIPIIDELLDELLGAKFFSKLDLCSGVKVSLEDVLCIFCKELLLEPCVLNCGHVYCLTCLPYVDEKEIKCQACGAPHPAKLTVCWNLDYFLKHYFFEEYNLRQQRVSYSGVPEKKTGPSKVQSSRLKHTHVGVGCDDCGVFPIQGRRYSCTECEAPGFDLCDKCFQKGTSTVGRFYQNHTAEHTMQLDDSFLFPKLLSYLDEKRRGEQHQDGSEEEDVVWVHEDEVGVVWDDE
uniref:ZZ-type domain-containing protein n=1 Tax=Oryza brachyantha TaxID=4533 RepID=J3NEY6_ORYBR